MSHLFSPVVSAPVPVIMPAAPPPPPTIDDAVAQRNSDNSALQRRGRATTVLTSDQGLPNLGTTATSRLTAGGGQ